MTQADNEILTRYSHYKNLLYVLEDNLLQLYSHQRYLWEHLFKLIERIGSGGGGRAYRDRETER